MKEYDTLRISIRFWSVKLILIHLIKQGRHYSFPRKSRKTSLELKVGNLHFLTHFHRFSITLEPDNSNDDGKFLEQVSVGLENMWYVKKKPTVFPIEDARLLKY